MTKVKILGQEEVKKEKKKIEFVKCLLGDISGKISKSYTKPNEFLNIELVCRAQNDRHYDVMFAYDNDRRFGVIYLGHFNDGEV